jgi:hypothetical protein
MIDYILRQNTLAASGGEPAGYHAQTVQTNFRTRVDFINTMMTLRGGITRAEAALELVNRAVVAELRDGGNVSLPELFSAKIDIQGAFPEADSAFDPAANSLYVERARVDGAARRQFLPAGNQPPPPQFPARLLLRWRRSKTSSLHSSFASSNTFNMHKSIKYIPRSVNIFGLFSRLLRKPSSDSAREVLVRLEQSLCSACASCRRRAPSQGKRFYRFPYETRKGAGKARSLSLPFGSPYTPLPTGKAFMPFTRLCHYALSIRREFA